MSIRALFGAVIWLLYSGSGYAQQIPTNQPNWAFTGCSPRVNYSNPLTQGLSALWVTIGGLQYELISNTYGIYTSQGPITGPYGQTTPFGSSNILFTHASVPQINNSNGLSVFFLGNPASSASNISFAVVVGFGTGADPNMGLVMNADETFSASAHSFLIYNVDSLSNIFTAATDGNGGVDGEWHVFIATIQGSNTTGYQIYVDNKNLGITVGSTTGPWTSYSGNTLSIGANIDGTNSLTGGSIAMVGAYNRILSPNDRASLTVNPYQLISCPVPDQLLTMMGNWFLTQGGSFIFKPF
jgi:hypothetical protein